MFDLVVLIVAIGYDGEEVGEDTLAVLLDCVDKLLRVAHVGDDLLFIVLVDLEETDVHDVSLVIVAYV